MAEVDWGAWSRAAVAQLQRKNAEWQARFALPPNAPYRWDLETAELRIEGGLVADLCLIGSTSQHEGTFLWAWANDGIPPAAYHGLQAVKAFGEANDLRLLVDAEWPGGKPEALEMLAIAARILDGDGAWIDTQPDLTLFFVLRNIRRG